MKAAARVASILAALLLVGCGGVPATVTPTVSPVDVPASVPVVGTPTPLPTAEPTATSLATTPPTVAPATATATPTVAPATATATATARPATPTAIPTATPHPAATATARLIARPATPALATDPAAAARGKAIFLSTVGCALCHTIDGLSTGDQGPNLTHIASQPYDSLPNDPPFLRRWISNPQAIRPGTLMPDLGLTSAQVNDLVAYLETMR